MPRTIKRDDRMELRVTPQQKQLFRRAAAARNVPVSTFALESLSQAAAETLASRTDFAISAKAYAAFVAALEAPVRAKPRLDRLMAEPSVLE